MEEQKLTSFDEDIFNRRTIAENLTKIIESKNEPMVISLDSEWGTGKTTFVTMWKNLLDLDKEYNTKFKTLYFNAWEHDYIKDPLLALFSEIEIQMKEDDGKLKQKLENLKNTLKPMTKSAATIGLKLITAGILDLEKINLGDFNESQLIELAGTIGDLSIKQASASKTIRYQFKEEMLKYQRSSGKKIIFFIDELDRCRPTFAIELLEVIKHLFNINNFIFVISIDKEQLSHSVSTIYGQSMDTVGYLRRFFDLDYRLPKIDRNKYIHNKNLNSFEKYKNIEVLQYFVKEMAVNEKLSLRDIDKVYYYIDILLPIIKEFNTDKEYKAVYIVVISYIYSILIIKKIKNPIIYKKIIDCDYNLQEILKEFNVFKVPTTNHIGEWSPGQLEKVIQPILRIYLELSLKMDRVDNISGLDSEKFMVGLKNSHGEYYWDSKFNMMNLFEGNISSISSKLEFVDGFSEVIDNKN